MVVKVKSGKFNVAVSFDGFEIELETTENETIELCRDNDTKVKDVISEEIDKVADNYKDKMTQEYQRKVNELKADYEEQLRGIRHEMDAEYNRIKDNK